MGWEHNVVLERRLDALEEKIEDMKVQITHVEGISGSGCYIKAYTTKEYLFGYQMRVSDGTVSKTTSIVYDNDNENYTGELVAPFSTNITIRLVKDGVIQAVMETTCDVSAGYSVIDLDALIDTNITEILKTNNEFFASCCEGAHFVDNDTLFPTLLAGTYEKDTERKNVARFLNTRSDNEYQVEEKTFDELFSNAENIASLFSLGGDFLVTSFLKHDGIVERVIHKSILNAIRNEDGAKTRFSGVATSSQLLASPYVKQANAENGAFSLTGDLIVLHIKSGCKGGSSSGSGMNIHTCDSSGETLYGGGYYLNTYTIVACCRNAYTITNGEESEQIIPYSQYGGWYGNDERNGWYWSGGDTSSNYEKLSINFAYPRFADQISRPAYGSSLSYRAVGYKSSATSTTYVRGDCNCPISAITSGVVSYLDLSIIPD